MTVHALTPPATPRQQTRAERVRLPVALDVLIAAAEQHGVCIRPFTMHVTDPDTRDTRYVPVACGSTLESVCGPCARKARALRMAQCREGWHLTEEPVLAAERPTPEQTAQLTTRADLVAAYQQALTDGRGDEANTLREAIRHADDTLRQLGVRGTLPCPDPPTHRPPKRSTKRRQDSPELPRRHVDKHTIGREYAGKFRPSMFITLTCNSYGPVQADGTPINPDTYDYRRAARDAVHFSSLVDRWWQNLRRVTGWDIQYFATVEPQKRCAPHLHAAVRGSLPHEVIRQVSAATYHQIWWPTHDEPIYHSKHRPVWDAHRTTFIDPDTREPLTPWNDALDAVHQPAHVVTFGQQVHSKGILGGTEEADRHIGYLGKYLTKSITEVVGEDSSPRQREHAETLHAELQLTPCSTRCPVWLLYGIQPQGASSRTVPGHCTGRAHRRSTLGLPGRRVLVSRKWSGKTLADHKEDRKAFVAQALAEVGIKKPAQDTSRLIWRKVPPGDPHAPPRTHLLMQAIAERIQWKAEYDHALLAAAGPPGSGDVSAIPQAA